MQSTQSRLTIRILLGLAFPLLFASLVFLLDSYLGDPSHALSGMAASAALMTAMRCRPMVTALVAGSIVLATLFTGLSIQAEDQLAHDIKLFLVILVGIVAVLWSISRTKRDVELKRFSRLAREFEATSKLALFDEMTGIYNRRGVIEALAAESLWPKSVAILDLDKFKAINDEFGHELGDHFIRVMARRTLSSVSASDIVGRWGGDEFIVVLPLGEAQAIEVMNRVISQISSEPIIKGKMRAHAKVSCGVSEWSKSETLESTLSLADARLFRAKSLGGNQVLGASGPAK